MSNYRQASTHGRATKAPFVQTPLLFINGRFSPLYWCSERVDADLVGLALSGRRWKLLLKIFPHFHFTSQGKILRNGREESGLCWVNDSASGCSLESTSKLVERLEGFPENSRCATACNKKLISTLTSTFSVFHSKIRNSSSGSRLGIG